MHNISIRIVTEAGEVVEAIPDYFKPLGYSELVADSKKYPIEFLAKSGNIKINGEPVYKDYTAEFNIGFNEEVTIYALELGGWLPISFINYPNIMPDRNVIVSIKQIKDGKIRSNTKSTEWWLNFCRDSSFTINPLLYAFEGHIRRFPIFSEFKDSFDEASQTIKEYFPNSTVVTYTDQKIYKKVHNLLREIAEKNSAEAEFLVKTAPFVALRPSDNEITDIQDTIDDIAIEHGLLGESLVYYLVVSCLYDAKDGCGYQPARKVLKPKEVFSKEKAYNAIADINALTIFIQSLSLQNFVMPVCTCDKPLAAFWVVINPLERTVADGKINVSFQCQRDLLPRLDQKEIIALTDKLNKKRLLTKGSVRPATK